MRRKISLYIGDQLADLSSQSFVLFNYTQADLTNPTLVKNAFTQQVTLPGTPANDRIFGHAFRLDRRTIPSDAVHTGTNYDPITRTPFTIYNEAGEVLEAGYLKLDRVERRASGPCSYVCTLYGGLGSFLYGLTYDARGEKLSLASLDFLGTGAPDSELDFTIEAQAVTTAWAQLALPEGSRTGIWSVLNFAPCYNGIPENFAAAKALATPGTLDIPNSVYDNDGNEFEPDGSGFVVVNMPEARTEWDVRDLRCYLQRPVVSVSKILAAIANPDNNGGWTVDLSAIDTAAEFPWQDMWLTLPLLPDLGTYKQSTGTATLVNEGLVVSAGYELGEYSIQYGTPPSSGTVVNTLLNCAPSFLCLEDAGTYRMTASKTENGVVYTNAGFAFIQAVAYDFNGVAVGASAVSLIGSMPRSYGNTIADLATAVGYTPVYGSMNEGQIIDDPDFDLGAGGYYTGPNLQLAISCPNAASFRIYVKPYTFTRQENEMDPAIYTESLISPVASCLVPLWEDYDTPRTPSDGKIVEAAPGSYATYETSARVRSGARISKKILLSGTSSPAEFLVSFCRMFGLSLVCDAHERTVQILRRDDFFQNVVEDLTKRIDTASGVAVQPVAVGAKWYDFQQPSVGGAFSEQYATVQGRQYGVQRVNTGWGFDANAVDVLSGTSFRSCAAVLGSSRYWYTFTNVTQYIPAVFQDTGTTLTYYNAGNTYAVDAGGITLDADVLPINPANPGYDVAGNPRAQFHGADGKPVDGSGVLLLHGGSATLPYFHVTDDETVMDVLVGSPCWMLDPGPAAGIAVPTFSRYAFPDDPAVIGLSLDFGVPAELDIPSVSYDDGATIYARCWRNYLADLYDRDTKIMTCKVDLRGYQVGPELLRRFWWYDGSLWVLNKITNHSLTTWDLTECEFVQVQDIDNYINGQN